MRLGRQQLAVLTAAAAGRAGMAHHMRGRMRVFGVDGVVDDDRVLDRMFDLGLIEHGGEAPGPTSYYLVPTAVVWTELERRGIGHPNHRLIVRRYSRGHAPIAGWGGAAYGCRGECSCGCWRERINEAPSAGGEDHVRSLHGVHVAGVGVER